MAVLSTLISCDTISYSPEFGFLVLADNGDIQFSGECTSEQLTEALDAEVAAALLESFYQPNWHRVIGRFTVAAPVTTNQRTCLATHPDRAAQDNVRIKKLLSLAAAQTASLRNVYGMIAALLDGEPNQHSELCNAKLAFFRAQTANQLNSRGGVLPVTEDNLSTLKANWVEFSQQR